MGKELAVNVRVTDEGGRQVVLPAGEEVPSWATDQVTNPAAFTAAVEDEPQFVTAEAASVAEGEGGDAFTGYADDELTVGDDYDAMTVADLKAEIRARNADRAEADQLPADGVKADLVAVLTADDAARS